MTASSWREVPLLPSPRSVAKLALLVAASVAVLTGFHVLLQGFAPPEPEGVPPELYGQVPGAIQMERVTGESGEVIYYEAYDSGGNLVGYGFVATFRGMWGDVEVAGGMDTDMRLTGVEVLSHEETPGIGSRIESPSFREQFVGLRPEQVELERRGGEVQAISGATVSSRSVTEGIRRAAERVEEEAGSR